MFVTSEGVDAFMRIIQSGNVSAVQAMVPLFVNWTNCFGETPLSFACRQNTPNGHEILRLLLQYDTNVDRLVGLDDYPTLCVALDYRNEYAVNLLLECNVNVNVQYFKNAKETPLLFASQFHNSGNVRKLLAHGASVNHQNSSGHTPLMVAASRGMFNNMKLLCKYGANVFLKDKNGMTALDHVPSRKGCEPIKRFLRRAMLQPPKQCLVAIVSLDRTLACL